MHRNTYFPDADLVYIRVSNNGHDDDLVEIAFEDMEPIECLDEIGIEPHTAVAISPVADFDCIGVAPYAGILSTPVPAFSRAVMGELEPDAVPTEEYHAWDNPEEHETAPEAVAL